MTISPPTKTIKTSQAIDIKSILELVADDMSIVNRRISENLNSDVALINQLGAYIVQAGGKRLRPVALLLTAKAVNPEPVSYTHLTLPTILRV